MATLITGQSQLLTLQPSDKYTVTVGANTEAYIDLGAGTDGSGYDSVRLTSEGTNRYTIGEYGRVAKVTIRCVVGSVDYVLGDAGSLGEVEVIRDENGNAVGLALPDGSEISLIGQSYQLSALPTPTSRNEGQVIRVTDVGMQSIGSMWQSDGVKWRPLTGRVTIAKGVGSAATPLATINAAGKISLPNGGMVQSGSLVIPANLLKVGMSIAFNFRLKHKGTSGAWSSAVRIGTANSNTDSSAFFLNGTATNDQDLWIFKEANISSATTLQTDSFAVPNSLTVGAFTDKNTQFNIANVMYLGVYIPSLSAGDSVDLLSYSVELVG